MGSALPTLLEIVLGIANHNLSALDQSFTADEVWHAIKELPADRVPGLDGFTSAFYKASWEVIKQDVLAALKAVTFGDSRMFHRLNSAIVVLIPKRPDATTPANFRPITMVHSFAKPKLLALRLAPRMKELVSPNQNAFIRGRTIHDNFKYVQRAAVLLRKKKIPAVLFKQDISKAFNTLAWPFLLKTMQAFGFSSIWRRWITVLLATASSRILLNGRPGKQIVHRGGRPAG